MSKDTMRIRFTGNKEIQRKLEMLPKEIAAGPMRDVAVMGGVLLKGHAIANATAIKRTGTLASNIVAELDKKETVGVRVTVRIGPRGKGWYGRLVERGHKIRWGRTFYDTDTGQRRKVVYTEQDEEVPPHPWLRPALDNNRKSVKEAMDAEMERRLKQWFG